MLRSSLRIFTSSWRRTCRCNCPLRIQWSPTARSTVLAPQKLCFGFTSGELVWSWLDTESRLKIVAIGRDSLLQAGLDFGTSETMYMLSILQSVEVNLQNYESVSWYFPSALLCFLYEWLLSFELDTLIRLSAGLLTIWKAPPKRPGWSVRCIRVATGQSSILTPGERPVLERLRPCTAPKQCLLERAILCETYLSQCLEARQVGK